MTQFDLEQQIMQCWSVCEDIEALRQYRDTTTMTEDQLDNYLLGLHTIYQVKFEKLFSVFEHTLRQRAT